ncbi:MAG: hydrogenase maturation protease [Pyrinomonadaceae bacterium]
MNERILIACIGNIFLGDDAFGCEVAAILALRGVPAGVRLVDFGIRSFDLAYALMDGYETTIFVDAAPRGDEPGTIYVIEPDRKQIDALEEGSELFEPHGMNPLKVLSMVRSLGGTFRKIIVVGCEPAFTGEEGEGHMGLSEPVKASLDKAVEIVESLVERVLAEENARVGMAAGV